MTIKAHFDGKNIVPHEPVTIPIGKEFEFEIKTDIADMDEYALREERLAKLKMASGIIKDKTLSLEATRRENI